MGYIERVIEDFKDLSIFPTWGLLSRRMNPDTSRTLVNPSLMTEEGGYVKESA